MEASSRRVLKKEDYIFRGRHKEQLENRTKYIDADKFSGRNHINRINNSREFPSIAIKNQ